MSVEDEEQLGGMVVPGRRSAICAAAERDAGAGRAPLRWRCCRQQHVRDEVEAFGFPGANQTGGYRMVAAAVHYGPGGQIVDAGATMFSSIGAGFAEFARAFGSGQGFGWHQRTIEHWHGQDAFTRATLPDELITAAVGALPDVAAALAAGGSVADVGCGYGAPTLVIARQYPAARVLGIDYHDASIAHCRALVAQALRTRGSRSWPRRTCPAPGTA